MALERRNGPIFTLGRLLGDAAPAATRELTVTGLTADSRRVRPGDLFLALPGTGRHGLEYAAGAIAAGAVAVAFEPGPPCPELPHGAVAFPVHDLRRRCGELADRFFGRPSANLQIAGVTGTNGKTTVAQLVAGAAEAAGSPCGVVGTVGCGRPGALRATTLTTADAVTVQAQLADLRDGGAQRVAMEVSSHALDQRRVDAVRFDTAVFTNLSRDHLDYHGTMADYLAAKARLFAHRELRRVVLNVDDPAGRTLRQRMEGSAAAVSEVGRSAAGPGRVVMDEVLTRADGLSVRLSTAREEVVLRSRLLGRFNAANLALAYAVLRGWDIPAEVLARALEQVGAPPGRMEPFGGGERPLAVVDYAHSPDALANALAALRAHCRGRLLLVFGCGGERDRGKRPQMAAVAAQGADHIVITDDNPRREDPDAIVADIVAGLPSHCRAEVRRDRRGAIASAIGAAGAGDVVLVAGKGHEDYQLVGDERLALDDRAEVARLLGGEA